jgi:hypothetical protein
MNNTQIKNGEVRIFPYYKGEYWGRSEVEFGFSNKSSALKYMKEIPKEDIYDSMGGYEKYYNENAYMLRFNTARLYVFNPRSSFDRRREGGCYDYDLNSEWVYLKDLDNKEAIENDIKDLGFREFEEKYGLFPHIYVDEKPYNSAKKKYIQDNVDFKQGIVKISVEFVEE